jgi:hypothetical protein
MPQIRRSILTILLLAAVATALVAYPGHSSASPRPNFPDPAVPALAPPNPTPDPNIGEPDSGSSRSRQAHARYGMPADNTQFAIRALRIVRWSSWIWMKRAIGVGE